MFPNDSIIARGAISSITARARGSLKYQAISGAANIRHTVMNMPCMMPTVQAVS